MSGYDTTQAKVRRYYASRPGQRGKDIPPWAYDRIFPVANGITQQIWGRRPTGEQLVALHNQEAYSPQEIHAAFNSLPHPHASSVSVGDYPLYAKAYSAYEEHRR